MAVATLGCAMLAGGDALSGSTDALLGDLLAVLGAATAAGYLLVGRRMRESLPLTPNRKLDRKALRAEVLL